MAKFYTSSKLRIAIIAVIVAIIGGGFYLHKNKTPSPPSYNPQNPSQSESNVSTEAPAETVKAATQDDELQKIIRNWAESREGSYAIAVREIEGSKKSASYRGDEPMTTASTYKLYLAFATLFMSERGVFELDTRLKNGQTAGECIETMLLQSSEDCTWHLGNTIGWKVIDDFLQKQGFKNTRINNYEKNGVISEKDKTSTANDEAELLVRLVQGNLLNEPSTELMLDNMKNQIWRERIPSGVPESIAVANKPGWLDDIENDAGIVFATNHTYVLVILSKDAPAKELADISRVVYDYFESK